MTDLLNLCLPCGLCCDGTVIGFVQLDTDELPRIKELMDIEDVDGKGFILQPCKRYCDGCTIYSQRPRQCASFKCQLLKSLEQKELDFDSAVEITNAIKHIQIAIEKRLEIVEFKLQSQSFYFKMVELKRVLQKKKAESSLTQNHLELLSDLKQLDSLLLKNFGLTFD